MTERCPGWRWLTVPVTALLMLLVLSTGFACHRGLSRAGFSTNEVVLQELIDPALFDASGGTSGLGSTEHVRVGDAVRQFSTGSLGTIVDSGILLTLDATATRTVAGWSSKLKGPLVRVSIGGDEVMRVPPKSTSTGEIYLPDDAALHGVIVGAAGHALRSALH